MSDASGLIGFLGLIVVGGLWLHSRGQADRIDHLENEKERLRKSVSELSERLASEQLEKKKALNTVDDLRTYVSQLKTVYSDRFQLFPWLSNAFSELETYRSRYDELRLSQKSHPAVKASEKVREYSQKLATEIKISRAMKYRLLFLESNFPWIEDLTGDNLASYLEGLEQLSTVEVADHDSSDDPVRGYLAPTEYEKLSPVERNQRALDRWMMRKRTPWQVGRDYERYIGYLLEQENYTVEYYGAIHGFDDLGRDIVASKKGETRIIQCKYWSQHKEIHEKHIFQIFGSAVEYVARSNNRTQKTLFGDFERFSNIHPEIVTSTKLSKRAKDFSDILGVKVRQEVPLGEYPLIKCNISQRNGERVYHLPFDQQYDKTRIEPEKGERYVSTTEEAEARGFRRAYRWKAQSGD